MLIEDCCQALYTRDEHGAWAGTSGDIALWSFRKFLASPDGGAVLVRAGPRVEPPPDRPPTLAASLRVALDFRAGLRADPRLPVRIAGAILGAMLDAFVTESDADRGPFDASSPTPYPFVPDEVRWRPSPVSIRILARTDDERVATRRRAHFARLAQAVRGQGAIEPAVVDLPAGACPSVFPIIARDPEAFIRRLIAARIPVDRYWQWCHPLFPATRFPVEADLKRRIVALPVHQDLTERELTLLASVLHQP